MNFMALTGRYISPKIKQQKREAKYCFYCFRSLIDQNCKKLSINAKTIDHFIPLTKGGTNFQYNIVICCHQCNALKADFLPNEFNTVVSKLWQGNECFKYSKQELRNIISQVKFIRARYDQNMRQNQAYYLIDLPVKQGMLEQLRKKYIKNNGFSLSNNQHKQTA
jgi:hypothetical protein